MTYMVHEKRRSGGGDYDSVVAHTLRDWCKMHGPPYNTVLARIWRALPAASSGSVVVFDSKDPILSKELKKEGKPARGDEAPSKKDPKPRLSNRISAKSAASVKRRNALKSERTYTAKDVKRKPKRPRVK